MVLQTETQGMNTAFKQKTAGDSPPGCSKTKTMAHIQPEVSDYDNSYIEPPHMGTILRESLEQLGIIAWLCQAIKDIALRDDGPYYGTRLSPRTGQVPMHPSKPWLQLMSPAESSTSTSIVSP